MLAIDASTTLGLLAAIFFSVEHRLLYQALWIRPIARPLFVVTSYVMHIGCSL
jgi:hypothetical protein